MGCLAGWEVFKFSFFFFSWVWKTRVGCWCVLVCGTMGTFLRIQTGKRERGYCGAGGLGGVTRWNVPAFGSCTATLFHRQHNPHVCTQGMLGTDFWHAVFGKPVTEGRDWKANVVTEERETETACSRCQYSLVRCQKILFSFSNIKSPSVEINTPDGAY